MSSRQIPDAHDEESTRPARCSMSPEHHDAASPWEASGSSVVATVATSHRVTETPVSDDEGGCPKLSSLPPRRPSSHHLLPRGGSEGDYEHQQLLLLQPQDGGKGDMALFQGPGCGSKWKRILEGGSSSSSSPLLHLRLPLPPPSLSLAASSSSSSPPPSSSSSPLRTPTLLSTTNTTTPRLNRRQSNISYYSTTSSQHSSRGSTSSTAAQQGLATPRVKRSCSTSALSAFSTTTSSSSRLLLPYKASMTLAGKSTLAEPALDTSSSEVSSIISSRSRSSSTSTCSDFFEPKGQLNLPVVQATRHHQRQHSSPCGTITSSIFAASSSSSPSSPSSGSASVRPSLASLLFNPDEAETENLQEGQQQRRPAHAKRSRSLTVNYLTTINDDDTQRRQHEAESVTTNDGKDKGNGSSSTNSSNPFATVTPKLLRHVASQNRLSLSNLFGNISNSFTSSSFSSSSSNNHNRASNSGDTTPNSSTVSTPARSVASSTVTSPRTPPPRSPLVPDYLQFTPSKSYKSEQKGAPDANSQDEVPPSPTHLSPPSTPLTPEHLPYIEHISVAYLAKSESAPQCRKLVMSIRRLSSPLPHSRSSGTGSSPSSSSSSSGDKATRHHPTPINRNVSVTMKLKESGKSRVDVTYRDGHRLLINPDNHTYEEMLGRIGNHADVLLNRERSRR